MAITTIHDLEETTTAELLDGAEIPCNNSSEEMVTATKVTVASLLAKLDIATLLTAIDGYDATETQVLKNVEGTLQWVTEAE